jgi:hypothetical protein
MTAARLLDRLDRVRQVGPGRWMAACPAHEDRSPSLSIRELDDGRILVHDFAGCDVQSVLSAVGLTLADLFHDRVEHEHRVMPTHSRVPLRDLVALLDHEAMIVALIGADVLTNKMLGAEDYERLTTAVRRIGQVRDYVN